MLCIEPKDPSGLHRDLNCCYANSSVTFFIFAACALSEALCKVILHPLAPIDHDDTLYAFVHLLGTFKYGSTATVGLGKLAWGVFEKGAFQDTRDFISSVFTGLTERLKRIDECAQKAVRSESPSTQTQGRGLSEAIVHLKKMIYPPPVQERLCPTDPTIASFMDCRWKATSQAATWPRLFVDGINVSDLQSYFTAVSSENGLRTGDCYRTVGGIHIPLHAFVRLQTTPDCLFLVMSKCLPADTDRFQFGSDWIRLDGAVFFRVHHVISIHRFPKRAGDRGPRTRSPTDFCLTDDDTAVPVSLCHLLQLITKGEADLPHYSKKTGWVPKVLSFSRIDPNNVAIGSPEPIPQSHSSSLDPYNGSTSILSPFPSTSSPPPSTSCTSQHSSAHELARGRKTMLHSDHSSSSSSCSTPTGGQRQTASASILSPQSPQPPSTTREATFA